VFRGLDDYPLPPPFSGGAPIHMTVIKTSTICYEAVRVYRYENLGPPSSRNLCTHIPFFLAVSYCDDQYELI
jgi:hypothetical protein